MDKIKMAGVQLGVMQSSGAICPICHNRIMRGMQNAVQFSQVDSKTGKVRTLYTHLTCAQEHNELNREQATAEHALSNEATLNFWNKLKAKSYGNTPV